MNFQWESQRAVRANRRNDRVPKTALSAEGHPGCLSLSPHTPVTCEEWASRTGDGSCIFLTHCEAGRNRNSSSVLHVRSEKHQHGCCPGTHKAGCLGLPGKPQESACLHRHLPSTGVTSVSQRNWPFPIGSGDGLRSSGTCLTGLPSSAPFFHNS